jgi:hypothetical protein
MQEVPFAPLHPYPGPDEIVRWVNTGGIRHSRGHLHLRSRIYFATSMPTAAPTFTIP